MEVLYFDDKKLDKLSQERLISLVDFVREVWDPDVTIESYLAGRSREFTRKPVHEGKRFPTGPLG